MTEDQSILVIIRDYWVQIGVFVSFIVGYANLKWQVKESQKDIEALKIAQKEFDFETTQKLSKLEAKIDAAYKDQSKDIKDILIMVGELRSRKQ